MAEKFVNEERIPCRLPNWPGWVKLPKELSASQFSEWWRKSREDDKDDSRPDEVKAWFNRRHLLLDFKLGHLTPQNFPPDMEPPSMELAMWFIGLTQPLLIRAQSLPNLQRPSKDTEPSTATT